MLQIIIIVCVTHVQKNFWIWASIKHLLTKYQIFTILPQILHFHKNRNFSSIFAIFETNCFIPINFMAGACQEYFFFLIFTSCEPLNICFIHTVGNQNWSYSYYRSRISYFCLPWLHNGYVMRKYLLTSLFWWLLVYPKYCKMKQMQNHYHKRLEKKSYEAPLNSLSDSDSSHVNGNSVWHI